MGRTTSRGTCFLPICSWWSLWWSSWLADEMWGWEEPWSSPGEEDEGLLLLLSVTQNLIRCSWNNLKLQLLQLLLHRSRSAAALQWLWPGPQQVLLGPSESFWKMIFTPHWSILWNNRCILVNQTSIFKPDWSKKVISFVTDLMNNEGVFLDYEVFGDKFNKNCSKNE